MKEEEHELRHHIEPKILTFKLIEELVFQYPEIEKTSLVKKCKSVDTHATGFITIQKWRAICGKEPTPFNFIKDQKFDKKKFKKIAWKV